MADLGIGDEEILISKGNVVVNNGINNPTIFTSRSTQVVNGGRTSERKREDFLHF